MRIYASAFEWTTTNEPESLDQSNVKCLLFVVVPKNSPGFTAS